MPDHPPRRHSPRADETARPVDQGNSRLHARSEPIEQTAGSLADAYDHGYLDRLREDWPE